MRKAALLTTVLVLAAALYIFDPTLSESLLLRIDSQHVAGVSAFLVANVVVVGIRFWLLLKRFGLAVPFGEAVHANTLSQVSGLFFLPMIGQYLGRAALLRRHRTPAAMLATITFYEKVVSLGAASALCLVGLVYLFGSASYALIVETAGPVLFFHILALGAIACAVGYRFGALRQERALLRRALTWKGIILTMEAAALTVVSQGCMVAAYAIIATALPAPPPLADLLAACTAIMFLAALPISINGWGIREMASAYMLGHLGVAAGDAVAVSIALGLAALLCLLLVAGFSLVAYGRSGLAPAAAAPDDTERSLRTRRDQGIVALLAAAIAIAVFFQLHIPVAGTTTAINLADPFAILGGGLFAMLWIARRAAPTWHVPGLNLFLCAATVGMVAAFLNGYLAIGLTAWALNNRLIGWLVILGYFFTGAAVVAVWGLNGVRRLSVGIAATAAVLSAYMILSALLPLLGFDAIGRVLVPNFGELAPNRNALAWQLILAFICVAALGSRPGRYLPWVASGLIGVGVILTGSRAGIGTLALIFVVIVGLRLVRWRQSVATLATIAALFASLLAAPMLPIAAHSIMNAVHRVIDPDGAATGFTPGGYGIRLAEAMRGMRTEGNIEMSDTERLETLLIGLELWADHPVVGAGLGAFTQLYEQRVGWPQVIHNTSLWLLAEFGIVGFMVVMTGFAAAALWSFNALHAPGIGLAARIVLLTLFAFAVFSTVHEILYQRLLWLVLGAALATRRPTAIPAPFRLPGIYRRAGA